MIRRFGSVVIACFLFLLIIGTVSLGIWLAAFQEPPQRLSPINPFEVIAEVAKCIPIVAILISLTSLVSSIVQCGEARKARRQTTIIGFLLNRDAISKAQFILLSSSATIETARHNSSNKKVSLVSDDVFFSALSDERGTEENDASILAHTVRESLFSILEHLRFLRVGVASNVISLHDVKQFTNRVIENVLGGFSKNGARIEGRWNRSDAARRQWRLFVQKHFPDVLDFLRQSKYQAAEDVPPFN
jgi:hypothetical protein